MFFAIKFGINLVSLRINTHNLCKYDFDYGILNGTALNFLIIFFFFKVLNLLKHTGVIGAPQLM